MGTRLRVLGRVLLCAVAFALVTSCGSGSSCATSPVPASCPDLLLEGHRYVVLHEVTKPDPPLQEVGDGTYPACNLSDRCGGDPLDGLSSTDVWRVGDLPSGKAVLGLVQGTTDHYAVYVRRGVDPSSLPLP
jgi:hypothetical protein